jgi:hypothetical protein
VVENKDSCASFKTIDEGAETVFSLSDAGFFHPARTAESIVLFKSHSSAAMLTRRFVCQTCAFLREDVIPATGRIKAEIARLLGTSRQAFTPDRSAYLPAIFYGSRHQRPRCAARHPGMEMGFGRVTRPSLKFCGIPIWVGVDASIKRDSTAIVATTWDKKAQQVRLVTHRVFQPNPDEPLDFRSDDRTNTAGP